MSYILRHTVLGIVAVLAFHVSLCRADDYIVSSARELPISAKVDVLVVGANEGGVAAAWKAARSGASVLVLAENYFLSDDVSAKARYWLEADEVPMSDFSLELFGSRSGGKMGSLVPWQYKMKMEEMLREAGAQYHHNSRPIGVLRDATGDIAGVVAANKAGVQAIIAGVVIDATSTGAVARMNDADSASWPSGPILVSRTAYKHNVSGSERYGDFYDYSLTVSMTSGNWVERCQAEVLLREKYNRVDGDKAHAQRMHMIEPVSIVTESTFAGKTWPDAGTMDLDVFRPAGMDYIYLISQSAGVPRSLAEKLTRPIHLAELGLRIGEAASQEAAQRSEPKGVSVFVKDSASGSADIDVHERLYGHRRWLRKHSKSNTVSQPDLPIPVWGEYEIVVVGAGPAGQSAAVAAARAGARVLLIEMLGQLGGNLNLGVGGYWRGYRGGFNETKPNFNMLRDAGVDIWYNTLGCGALKTADQVVGVTVAGRYGRGAVLAKVVIDGTGDADICAAAGAEFSYVNNGDLAVQESSYKGMGGHLYLNVLPLDTVDVVSYTNFHYFARSLGTESWDFYPMAGIRETRLVKGEHVISVLDQVTERTYSDLISVSLSAYDPHGYHDSDYCYLGLTPINKWEANYNEGEGVLTYIPLRSLLPYGLKGIMMVGRCFSVSHDAQASARMNPDMINQAYGAGYVAARAVGSAVPLRQVDMAPVQDHLVQIGNITAEHRDNAQDMQPPTENDLVAAAQHPEIQANMATLMYGGPKSIPPLKASFASAATLDKAKALCALGDTTAVDYLTDWLDKQPLGTGLAYEWDNFLKYNTDPDLEIECVMWLLGAAGDDRAVAPLVAKLEQCETGGTSFSRIRAITGALGRIGSPIAAPALHDFLLRPGVIGHSDISGSIESIKSNQFSQAYLELYLAGALFKCGDHNNLGRAILLRYMNDWRGIFHLYAGHLLYAGLPICEKVLSADLNADCRVDMSDFLLLSRDWLRSVSPPDRDINRARNLPTNTWHRRMQRVYDCLSFCIVVKGQLFAISFAI